MSRNKVAADDVCDAPTAPCTVVATGLPADPIPADCSGTTKCVCKQSIAKITKTGVLICGANPLDDCKHATACVLKCSVLDPTNAKCGGAGTTTTACPLAEGCAIACSNIAGTTACLTAGTMAKCPYKIDGTTGCGVASQAKIELQYAGALLNANRTEILNTGDALLLHARGYGGAPVVDIAQNIIPGFVVTKNAPPTTIGVTFNTGGSPATVTVNNGVLVYDTINGGAKDFDHFVIRYASPIYDRTAALQSIGFLHLYIPSLAQTDAGTYYVSYMDGAAATNTASSTSLATSYAFRLVVQTKPGSNSPKLSSSLYYKLISCSMFMLYY